jgi:hypothetical protein
MKMHKAILDVADRLVHLCSPMYGKVTKHLPVIAHIKASLHHVVELKLKDIHVVLEFPDVFPDDLPGMPPERAIEYVIKENHNELVQLRHEYGVHKLHEVCRRIC